MKKTTYLFYIILIIISFNSFGQVYQGDLTLSTQAQINSFNYTTINGTLTISETNTSNINNLNGLSSLTHINGGLSISNNNALSSLNGLDNLTSIGTSDPDFFGYAIGLEIQNNSALTIITALSNLTSIGSNLTIENNGSLESLNGLEGITSLNGNLYITENINLASLQGLNNITSVIGIGFFGGGVTISKNNALTSMLGLNSLVTIDGTLYIAENDSITSLIGLDAITTITRSIDVFNNDSLINLQGLENLANIGDSVTISFNNSLTSLIGLVSTNIIPGSLTIQSNISLISLEGLENLVLIGHNLIISAFVNGDGIAFPGNTALTSLDLNSLTSIGEYAGGVLIINGCNSLLSLDGLENLNTIQPEYHSSTNVRLEIGTNLTNQDVQPISNLYNPQLSEFCGIKRLITLEEITSSTSIIENNAFNPTISEIENLSCVLPQPSQTVFKWRTAIDTGNTITETINGITATFIGSNPNILDVSGLGSGEYNGGGTDNVIQASSSANVTFSFSEPVDVISIMTSNDNYQNNHTFTPIGGDNNVVAVSRSESGTIFLNWQGITSFSVSTTSSYFGFDDLRTSPNTYLSTIEKNIIDTMVYPNPTKNSFFINSKTVVTAVYIYDTFGKLVKTLIAQNEYDVSGLSKGLYLVNIVSDNGNSVQKLIID